MTEALEESSATAALELWDIYRFSREDYLGAIRGEKVPQVLRGDLMRKYLVRGIRHQVSISLTEHFARELYGVDPLFSRAINARRIMSNRIDLLPPVLTQEEMPYCIWYPNVAEESTYRELVARCSDFKYHVGRACAVANYTTLYGELDILPEVHIAEEARECGSAAIYETIMASDVQFDIMNDYERTIKPDPPISGCLNGDTVVRRMLEVHYCEHPIWREVEACNNDEAELDILEELDRWSGIPRDLGITEDAGIAEHDSDLERREIPGIPRLLSEPLPKHLPIIEKDLLIHVAAYDGNIERYSRLRRPRRIRGETAALVNGIYHHTQFALWVLRQSDVHVGRDVTAACHARLIMNNILSSVNSPTITEYDLPYLIWWPDVAAVTTYRELYRLHPCMAPQILRACMAGGYSYLQLFEHILSKTSPDEAVLWEAKGHADPYYHARVAQRIADVGGEVLKVQGWKRTKPGAQHRWWAELPLRLEHGIATGWAACNDDLQCDLQDLNFMTCVPDEWMRTRDPPNYPGELCLDYINWPPGWEIRTKSGPS